MKQLKDHPAIIIGGGIAGLSSALALAHKGIASIIVEKRIQLDNTGFGIQLPPNATRIFARWKLLGRIVESAIEPHFLELRDGISLKTHLCVSLANLSQNHWKAPYIVIRRADLQKVLYDAAIQNPLIQHKAGETLVSFNHATESSINVETVNTKEPSKTPQYKCYTTSLLIGCDGIWSKLRQSPPFHEKTDFSGFSAWRTTTILEKIPEKFRYLLRNMQTIIAWMGPRSHLVFYPIQSGEVFNLIAVTCENHPEKEWKKTKYDEKLKSCFKNWNSEIIQIFDHIDEWSYWPLFQTKYPRFLGLKRQVFVGDCAHAISPFAAQGAAMAIEDSATLAEVLSISNLSLTEAIALYEKIRKPRIMAVKKLGDFNRLIYHAAEPLALARNFVFKISEPQYVMSRLDWLYMYDSVQATREHAP